MTNKGPKISLLRVRTLKETFQKVLFRKVFLRTIYVNAFFEVLFGKSANPIYKTFNISIQSYIFDNIKEIPIKIYNNPFSCQYGLIESGLFAI
ncbi:hypothetical protein BpHYR1_045379 [Brachionus plicatilis]|uniref:Uncharacterized protein n=1 Tax=Brachionus plicatilis TaxID=10195 RepID=A0A3M7QQE2_BRAPC|nr:hypothetical protein BpHYR1_045379 [Brachionus plicatilis]